MMRTSAGLKEWTLKLKVSQKMCENVYCILTITL
jgi:hypothetical protein